MTDFNVLWNNAKTAAERALTHTDTYPCGFAWITIKPARGPFIRWCKQNNIGRNGVYGGWEISFYELNTTYRGQNMYEKIAAVSAAVNELQAAGILARVNSRID